MRAHLDIHTPGLIGLVKELRRIAVFAIAIIDLIFKVGAHHFLNLLKSELRAELDRVRRSAQVMDHHPLEPSPDVQLVLQLLDLLVRSNAETARGDHSLRRLHDP